MESMAQIKSLDAVNGVAVVGAGVKLQQMQEAAQNAGLLFPVDFGARGSATIGGAISTNAGGEKALRFGMMREQVLGLEVVLASGKILDLMGSTIKNNAGYDLKHLFIGSEGTLGIVNCASLTIQPGAGVYVLLEAESGAGMDTDAFIEKLAPLVEEELVVDIAIANSVADRQGMWAIRNNIEAIIHEYFPGIAYDISLPIAEMSGFVETIEPKILANFPTASLQRSFPSRGLHFCGTWCWVG